MQINLLKTSVALAGVAQWIDCPSANLEVAGWIPSQGTCVGSGPGPWLGAFDRQQLVYVSHICFYPSFSPRFPLFLKINK